MDLAGKPQLEAEYLRVAHAAWRLATDPAGCGVVQGIQLTKVQKRVEELLAEPVPDVSVRKFAVMPESTAPLMSYLMHPQAVSGLYLLADMGAGSTELSMNKIDADLRGTFDEPLVNCYSARTFEFGGDNFDAFETPPEPAKTRQAT
jgi:hypothetical protein